MIYVDISRWQKPYCLTIFIEEVNSDRDEGEEGIDDQQSLEDDLVVQVAKSHRLEIDSMTLMTTLGS